MQIPGSDKSTVCALAVMSKVPQAGASKTRLTPPLTSNEAAILSACFLRDTCENISHVSVDGSAEGIVVYTPAGAEDFFEGLLPESFSLLAQRGNTFGERLFYAAQDVLALGYGSVCLIDSDSPTLPSNFLRSAISTLSREGDRVVLGEAEDGGYYLIGLKQAHRRVFEDVAWSTASVLEQTITRVKEMELPVTVLPAWFDVDDATGLRQLCNELFWGNGNGNIAYQAPHTRSYLAKLIETASI